jgi:hypothetical protein
MKIGSGAQLSAEHTAKHFSPGKAKRDNWLTSGDWSVSLTARKHGDLLEVTFWNNATKKNNVVVFDLTNDGVIGQASHHGFQKAKDAAFRSVTE